MRFPVTAFLLFLVPAVALAQDVPATGDAQPTAALKRILVIGDQMAGGMGAGLARMAEGDATLQVINRFNESSGLARPEIYDWAAAIPKMAEAKNFSGAVVLLGLNDRRDLKDGDKVLKFGTAEWDVLYKSRIDAVLDALAAQHIQVFWMGEPPMGEPLLDADMQNITALVKERVAAKNGGFIDLRVPFLAASGGYTDRGLDDTGVERRLRESDGVTFFKQGNNRLGQIALAAVKNVPAAAGVAPSPPAAPADTTQQLAVAQPAPLPQAPPPKEDDQGPIFGQEGLEADGARQGSTALSVAVENDKQARQAAASSVIGIAAAKGSAAEALFTTGLSKPAPTGRFDDFTVKPIP